LGLAMRTFLAATFVLAMSGSAIAQTCVTSGNYVFCNNGTTGQQFGTTTYWSDGLSSHQNRFRLGNPTTYFSNGVTAHQFGNTTYFSDGRTCTRFGNTTHCN
jgi:hypothetical protein